MTKTNMTFFGCELKIKITTTDDGEIKAVLTPTSPHIIGDVEITSYDMDEIASEITKASRIMGKLHKTAWKSRTAQHNIGKD